MIGLTSQEIAVRRAISLLDMPYHWNGKRVLKDGGLDCSGLVEDCLATALGRLPYAQAKASFQQLKFWGQYVTVYDDYPEGEDVTGWLIYWLNTAKTRVCHVEIAATPHLSIGARGDNRAQDQYDDDGILIATAFEQAKKYDMRAKCRATFGRSRKIAGIINPYSMEIVNG